MKTQNNIAGFSIIEVLIGIFIFTLGLISIYLIMVSSLRLNDYNKNQIIASNLAREQIELLRNMRDSNYTTLHGWDSIPGTADQLTPDSFYKIENNFAGGSIPVNVTAFASPPVEGEENLATMNTTYRLCLDPNNRYTFDCAGDHEPTPFYKYLKIEDSGVDDAVRVISKVIWYKRGYHDLEINTILTDWKRL